MDDNRLHTNLFQQNDIIRKALFEMLFSHGITTIFDDNGFTRKTLNIRQSFA